MDDRPSLAIIRTVQSILLTATIAPEVAGPAASDGSEMPSGRHRLGMATLGTPSPFVRKEPLLAMDLFGHRPGRDQTPLGFAGFEVRSIAGHREQDRHRTARSSEATGLRAGRNGQELFSHHSFITSPAALRVSDWHQNRNTFRHKAGSKHWRKHHECQGDELLALLADFILWFGASIAGSGTHRCGPLHYAFNLFRYRR